MTKQLEHELTAWMRRQADQAPHDTDLEPGAFRKSRKIRLQRRITSAVVVAAVLGLAVPAGLQAINLATGPNRPQVADSPTTIETPLETPTPLPEPVPASPVKIDFDQLPHGVTSLPWWSWNDRAIHDGSTVISNVEAIKELAKLGEHQFAAVTDPEQNGIENIELVGMRDPTTVAADGGYSLAISQDGTEIAWMTNDSKGLYSVKVASTKTGKLVDTHNLRKTDYVHVVGFVGRDVLISSDRGADVKQTFVWQRGLPNDYVLPITNAMYAIATSRNSPRVSILSNLEDEKSGNGRWCGGVVSVPDLRQVWKSCDLMAVSFSPDGRYALAQPSNTEGAGTGSLTVVDLQTGKTGLQVRADLLPQFAWEADSKHFVVDALIGGKSALVRSDLYGNLELVSTPATYEYLAGEEPYVLGSR